jgi:uncharacterized membrane protein YbhN (UPF0104 family)
MLQDEVVSPPIKWNRIWLPVLLSVGVSFYLIYTNFSAEALHKIELSKQLVAGLFFALITVLVRDAAYMYRIRTITGNKLSWWVSLQVILLWEFGSAITPGAVGGIALALFILRKEGISYGQTIATIMLTTILDNLAFVLVFTGLVAYYGPSMFSIDAQCADLEGHQILQGFRALSKGAWIVYGAQIVATAFLLTGLFLSPALARKFFYKIASWRLLSRFQKSLQNLGDDLVVTSATFSKQPFSFWLKIILFTLISWVSRYALVNTLVFTFADFSLNMGDIFARQYVLWTFLLLPSTPGASGLAELSFIAMNCEFIPAGLSATVATVWRLYSYYIYIILGVIVLPKWLKRVTTNTPFITSDKAL